MYGKVLETASNWAAILTAVIAVLAYARFALAQRSRRKALEAYLREQRLLRIDEGRRSVMHLMAQLSMTESEVLQAGFQSKLVNAVPGNDEKGRANRIYFEYIGPNVRTKFPL